LSDLILIDFGTLFDPGQLVVEEGQATVVENGRNKMLQLNAAPGQRVKIRLSPTSGTWNLLDYVNLTMDVDNLAEGQAWFRLLIKDTSTTTESWYRPNISHNGWVWPGEKRVFDALLVRHRYKTANQPSYLDLFPNMQGLPHAQMLSWFGLEMTKISEIVLSLEPQDYEQILRIDNIRGNRRAAPTILQENPNDFFPFIDAYGQYMHEYWPGKIMSDADLIAAKASEEYDLIAHPHPAQYNEYGGWENGPTLEATGHFRTEKRDGKWWFVDPAGKLFWSLGSTGVGLVPMKVDLTGKAHFYEWLPDRHDPVFGDYYTTTAPGSPNGDYYDSMFIVLYKKHGVDFANTYTDWALRRIRSWSLNTLGAWSPAADNQPQALKTPYTRIIWTPGKPISQIGGLDDPFDPGFSAAVATAIGWIAHTVNDPYCIGYFDNNEIQWGRDPVQVVRDIIAKNGQNVAARVELVDFLKAEYGTISAANAAWGSSFSSWDALLPAIGSFNYSGADEVLQGFYEHLTDTYYRKSREAIKSVAPNKLYLGSRIHDNAMRKEVAAAAARHCDVVSFNIYEKDVEQFNIQDSRDLPFFQADKPFMVGEFNFGALDRGKFFTGIGFAADQRNRGEAYTHYVRSALRNARCVGVHWFQYADQPTAARHKGAENSNSGLINSADSPYRALIKAIRSIGSMMYSYRNEYEPN
jgi:hypothetical protein